MKRRSIAIIAFLAVCMSAAGQTQDVTKIGLCDFTKVLQTAYRDTKAFRDYDQARSDYVKELSRLNAELTDLQSQKLDADKAKDGTKSLTLQKTIDDKKAYLDTYRTVKSASLAQQGNTLLTGPVLSEILDVVRSVAEAGGYALILRSDTDAMKGMMLYSIPDIDVTGDVVAKIQERQGKPTG
jgi:Skp family chaperone for outer membrane proteins